MPTTPAGSAGGSGWGIAHLQAHLFLHKTCVVHFLAIRPAAPLAIRTTRKPLLSMTFPAAPIAEPITNDDLHDPHTLRTSSLAQLAQDTGATFAIAAIAAIA